MSRSERTSRRPLLLRQFLLAYAVVILGIGWGLQLWQIQADRRTTLGGSQDDLITLATGLQTQLIAMINDGVGAAVAAANEVNESRVAPSEAAAGATLGRMLTGGEYVRELFLATPSQYASAKRADHPFDDAAMRRWTAALFEPGAGSVVVGPLIPADVRGETMLLPIARRIVRRTAHRAAEPQWAGAVFSLDALHALYQGLPLASSAVSLVTEEGLVVMRAPGAGAVRFVGRDVSASTVYARVAPGPGKLQVLEAPNPLTGAARSFAIVRVEGYPLLAVAARDIHDALAPWRERTYRTIQLSAFVTLAWLVLSSGVYVVLKRRDSALRRSAERFKLATLATNDGIWDWDARTDHIYYSRRLKQHFGYEPRSEFTPTRVWERTHPEDAERVRQAVRRHLKERTPFDVEARGRLRNGEYRWFRCRGQAVWDASGQPIRMIGALTDIHEQRLAAQALARAQARELEAREEFAQHLLLAQEQERQRLAGELHDSVGQKLSLIRNRALLALQERELEGSSSHVTALAELTSDVIAEVRRVAHSLRPLPIEHLGLREALEALLEEVSASSRLQIDHRLEDADDALDAAGATHLYRIVQEALTNVLKHADARRCRVALERDLRVVRLTIADDGRGFDPQASKLQSGVGLASIAERARMMNATLRIDAASGEGATIIVEAPIMEPVESHELTEQA